MPPKRKRRRQPHTALDYSPQVPSLVLADTLMFADPSVGVLKRLPANSHLWTEAVVLAPRFWSDDLGKVDSPRYWCDDRGKLNRIDIVDIPPVVAASLQFDPNRLISITQSSMNEVDNIDTAANVLLLAQRVEIVGSSWDKEPLPLQLLSQLMPNLRYLDLSSVNGIQDMPALTSVRPLETLKLPARTRELSVLSRLPHLSSVEVNGIAFSDVRCFAQYPSLTALTMRNSSRVDGMGALPPLANLQKLDVREFGGTIESWA